MKFSIPGVEPSKPEPIVRQERAKKVWQFDPEEPLPDDVVECDDLAEKLWELGDTENWQTVARHANDLVGWKRYEVSTPMPIKRIVIGDQTETVLKMARQNAKVSAIAAATGMLKRKIRKIISDASAKI